LRRAISKNERELKTGINEIIHNNKAHNKKGFIEIHGFFAHHLVKTFVINPTFFS
jgi:hypothetical protein